MALRIYKNRKPQAIEQELLTPEVVELNDRLDEMVRLSVADAEPWLKMGNDALDYTYGNQLKYFKLKDGWKPVQLNRVYPAQQQQLALVMQRTTTLHAEPWEDEDIPGSKVAEDILRWYYEIGIGVPRLQGECTMDGQLFGSWVLMVHWDAHPDAGWDEESKEWRGEVKVSLVPYTYFGVAPRAETFDEEWCFVQRQAYVEELKQRWPEYEDRIEEASEREYELQYRDKQTGGVVPTGFKAHNVGQDESGVGTGEKPSDKFEYYGRLAAAIKGRDRNLESELDIESKHLRTVTLLEIWFRDRRIKHVVEQLPIADEELEEQGAIYLNEQDVYVLTATDEPLTEANRPTQEREYDQPLFPNGRHILRIGEIILNPDDEDQRWPMKRWPFVTGQYSWLPHTWRGSNGVELLRETQDMENEVFLHVTNYVKCFGDPRVFVELGALAEGDDPHRINEQVKTGAGKVIMLNPDKRDGISFEGPPEMGGSLFNILGYIGEVHRDMHGVQDVMQGKAAGQRTTATESLRLETNSRMRTGMLTGELERTTGHDLMSMVWDFVQAHMSVGQMVRIAGEGSRERIIEIKGGYVDEETEVEMRSPLDAQFDLKLEVATTMPFDKQRKKEESLQLMDVVGPAYLRRLLEAYDVTNIEEILMASGVSGMVAQIEDMPPELAEPVVEQIQAIVQDAVAAQQSVENGMGGGGQTQQQQGAPQGDTEQFERAPGGSMTTPEEV